MDEVEKELKKLYGESIADDDLASYAKNLVKVFKLLYDIAKQNPEYDSKDK